MQWLMAFADAYIETLRCQSLSVRKQDGRSGLYGRERDPRGMGSKRREVVEKKRGQAANHHKLAGSSLGTDQDTCVAHHPVQRHDWPEPPPWP